MLNYSIPGKLSLEIAPKNYDNIFEGNPPAFGNIYTTTCIYLIENPIHIVVYMHIPIFCMTHLSNENKQNFEK